MKIRLVRVEKNFEFPFPGHRALSERALLQSRSWGGGTLHDSARLHDARGTRTAEPPSDPCRLETGSSYRSLIQFGGTDDYAQTGDCICILNNPDSNEWISTSAPVPTEYAGHRIVIFERHIGKGGADHWGFMVNEGEIDDMLHIECIHATHKVFK